VNLETIGGSGEGRVSVSDCNVLFMSRVTQLSFSMEYNVIVAEGEKPVAYALCQSTEGEKILYKLR
jgi:hypothetical protein